jgi:hypothetical protein
MGEARALPFPPEKVPDLLSVSGDCRGGEKDFCQAPWERTWIASANLSESPILQMDQIGGW